MKVKVITLDNTAAGDIELDDAVFGVEVRRDLLHRMVNYQQARRQQGTHKTKTVSEISGTTKKPFRQKGSGRARQGSLRSAQFRGGQTTFGPVPRSHAHDLPKKVRKLALKSALSDKCEQGRLIVLDEATAQEPRTKGLAARFAALGWSSALIVGGGEIDRNFALAARNIPHIDVLPQAGANVCDILRRDLLVLTRDAAARLEERLK